MSAPVHSGGRAAAGTRPTESKLTDPSGLADKRFLTPFSLLLCFCLATVDAQPAETTLEQADWQPARAEEVRSGVFDWLDARGADDATRAAAAAAWPADSRVSTAGELLTRLARTVALADPNAQGLVELCSKPRGGGKLPSQAWLGEAETPPLVAHNLRLLYGRWLVQERLYDEALQQLEGLQPRDVVDPASLLFCQAVAHQRLLNKPAAEEAIGRLLAGADESPRRYVALARLMQTDVEGLQVDSLDHIARRMEDIERRLDLGRAGQKVRAVEDGVVESLDKLIKKLEEQQQQSSSASADSLQSSSPAQDSLPMGGKGRGEVTKRNVGSESGWGDLPPKQREETLQEIGRRFPAHYRDVIEQYFRKLASEEGE
ncbi:MAG: hypothetical protein ACYTG0_24530 [Planctomycetota bacterium]